MSTYELILDNAKMQIHCNEEAPIIVDKSVTRVRIFRSNTDVSENDYLDMGGAASIVFDPNWFETDQPTQTTVLIIEIDGHAFPGEDYIPPTPDGYVLADVRPWVIATVSPAQTAADLDTGYIPEPTLKPFLTMDSSVGTLTLQTFDGTLRPCLAHDYLDAFLSGGGGSGADNLQIQPVESGDTTVITVTSLGYRFRYVRDV